MIPTPPHSADVLARYLDGVASPDECRAIEAWLASASPSTAVPSTDARWARLVERVGLTEQAIVPERREGRKTHPAAVHNGARHSGQINRMLQGPRRSVGWALLGCASIAAVIFGLKQSSVFKTLTPAQIQHYQTAPGEQKVIDLADGSSIRVAPASRVDVAGNHVHVSGEAYFSVVPHTGRPLIVRTNNLVVRVLGTRFVVRQYDSDVQSRVVVEEGRVALQVVRDSGHVSASTVLSANMMAVVMDSTVNISQDGSVSEYTMWTHGGLVFRKAPVGDVIREVSRMYGVDVRVTDTVLARQPITITIAVSEDPLLQVLEVIGLAREAHVVKNGTVLTLVPGRDPNRIPVAHPSPQLENHYGQ